MADQLSLANRALLQVGARNQISSLTPSDGSVEANAVTVLWQPTFEELGRAAHWNCLRKQIVLSMVQAAQGTPENPNGTTFPIPPLPWLYAYAYPSDCLQMRYIIPSLPASSTSTVPQTTASVAAPTWLPTGGQIPYLVSTINDSNGQPILAILTNQDIAQAAYTSNQSNPAGWDSMFQAAFVASLGAFLVPALSLSLPLMQLSIQTAERIILQARVSDGNEGVTTLDHVPDWISARLGGSGYGYNGWNNFSLFGGFVNMNWPSWSGAGGGTFGE